MQNADYFSEQVSNEVRFCRNLSDYDEKSLFVVSGGRELCSPGYSISRKSFPYFAVEYLHTGKGVVLLNGEEYLLTPGSLFCYGPGISHEIYNRSNEPMLKYFVDFSGSRAHQLVTEFEDVTGKVLHNSMPNIVHNTFEELLLYGFKTSAVSEQICLSLLKLLVYKMIENQLPLGESGSVAHETYIRTREQITENFLILTSLNDISNKCNIDGSYLCRLFKLYDRETPYRYLQRLQMNYAADRMVKGGYSVKEMARQMSYSDQFHFSRAFKTIMGVSPSIFRKLTGYHKEK